MLEEWAADRSDDICTRKTLKEIRYWVTFCTEIPSRYANFSRNLARPYLVSPLKFVTESSLASILVTCYFMTRSVLLRTTRLSGNRWTSPESWKRRSRSNLRLALEREERCFRSERLNRNSHQCGRFGHVIAYLIRYIFAVSVYLRFVEENGKEGNGMSEWKREK